VPLPIGIARRRFGPGLGFAKQAQGQFPPTGAIRFGAGAGNDGLVSTKPVGFNVHSVWGWFRMRQSQVGLLVQMCGASLESVAPDGSGPYQLLFESTFQTNTVELHDNINGGFLFTPTMQPMEWWFIASVNNRDAAPAAGQTTFYARRMGDSSPLVALTGNTHPAATKATRFLVGTDDAGGQNEWWDGDIAGLGVASRAYSTAEMDAQSRQLYPVSMLGLHAFYPLQDTGSMLLDASGRQRHLAPIVSGGSWSRMDGPQIPLGLDAFSPLAADLGPTPAHPRMPVGQSHARFSGMDRGFRAFVQATDSLVTPPATGTIAITEADDVLAASGSEVTGASALSEAGDAVAAAGSTVTGTVALTEAGDALASAGSTVTGTIALTEAGDAAAVSGAVVDFTGTVSVTEAGDVLAASGSSTTGTIAVTEAADALSATGSAVDFIGTASLTEADDTCSATGSFTASGVTGSAALTEASDTSSATGVVIATGTASLAEAGDTLAASGTQSTTGSAALTETGDTTAATGSSVTGSIALVETDSLSATGARGAAGTVPLVEAGDALAASGARGAAGSIAVTETGDVLLATDHTPVSGTIALIEAGDTWSSSGQVIEIIAVTGFVEGPTALTGAAEGALALVAAAEGPVSLPSYADGVLSLVGHVE
jgi:hypothetical protein